MISFQNKIIQYDKSNESINPCFLEAKQGRFWHWRRVYILKDSQRNIYLIQLNLFERIYGNLAGFGIEGFFRKKFSDRKITGLANNNEIDLLIYNRSKSAFLRKQENSKSSLEIVYQEIAEEALLWRGKSEINLNSPVPQLNGPCQRKEWWGRFAQLIGSTGLNEMIHQTNPSSPGIALDVCCGASASAFYLLQKGWTVICVDYSQSVLDTMGEAANRINKEWLTTRQLVLVNSSIEDYACPTKVDLVIASSALPYIDPSKIKTVMSNIYQSLKPNGHFVGNLFALEYAGPSLDISREMGAWFVRNKHSVGYLLSGEGFEVIKCAKGGQQNPHSVVFIGKKTQDALI